MLLSSIIITVVTLFLGESAAFFMLSRLYDFGAGFFLVFLAAQAGFDLVVLLFLAANRGLFYNIHSGEAEPRVNLSNKITLFRITMLPFLIFLIYACGNYDAGPALVISIALTFLSDFFDGRLARAKNLETCMGKILDSAGDYLVLGATAAAFCFFRRIKTWLFLLIIGRLFIHSLGMLILCFVRKKLSPQTTLPGKVSVAAIMVFLVLESAVMFLGRPWWMGYVEIAVGVVIFLSIIDKFVYLARGLLHPEFRGSE
ncbi:MAG: CDP-alcohol phosphatidyltransferase family protein [Treponema sp.]|jgi:CDP-diacylglycerol--glycerol-3-phosphate 3-phosphatidyltransferase|nr:CDP-alcohol phosphatidyltransferase family protein [Treponema sp.]